MADKPKGGGQSVRTIVIGVIAVAGFLIVRACMNKQSGKASDPSSSSAPQSAPAEAKRPFSGPGYVLEFSSAFNPGANAVDDLGLSVVIAVDVSGSMADPPAGGGDAKNLQATRALSDIVSFLDKLRKRPAMRDMALKVGILRFNAEVGEIFPLTSMDDSGFERLRGILASGNVLSPGGRTAIGLALEKGAEILAGSGTIMKSLIVVSDGASNEGPAPEDALFAINENRNDSSTVDFPVITRGTIVSFIGFDVDSGIYAPVAERGARLESAANQAELEKALTSVLVADISRLEAAP
jgi:hypothetical protein